MPSTNTSLDKDYDAEKQERAPEFSHLSESDSESNPDAFLNKEIEQEKDSQIKYRSCSWQKTAGLLFSEYICLAIMSFPWSFSILGLVPGLIITVFISLTVAYTGCIIGDYCARYPHIQSICDIGQHLFWGKKWAWYATAACFILNNTLIQALHVLVGAKYLNTVSNHGACTVVFAVVSAIICCIFSLPRTFSHMSFVGIFAAATMFVSVILSIIFAAIQEHPEGYDGTPVNWNLWPEKGTTYVSGMAAMLNIVYTFVGQICYPSFISEMKNPKDFKKAIYVVTICEVVVFALAGAIVYVYAGNYYMVAPAFGVLTGHYKTAAFSFAIPTIVFLGSLYSNVSSQFIFLKVFHDSKHKSQHTVKGWGFWIGLNVFFWIVAFVVAQVIPFFSDLLSLMSSLFDCWFGFVFWGVAFIRLRQDKYKGQFSNTREFWKVLNTREKVEYILCIILIIMGIYIFGPGTYASIDSIVLSYQDDAYGSVFSCASNGL